MLVVGLGPFRVGSVVWQPRADAWRLTVVCKGTFVLAPGESRLAETQEELVTHDEHWNDDATRSLTAASDMSPFKMRADVLLVGQAFAPRAEPVRSLVARMIVAEMDKAVEVFGNRNLSPDGTTSEPTPFVRMPLRYERAAGGPDSINPVGIPDAAPDSSAPVPLPNLEPTGARSARISADGRRTIEPVGLGPVAPSWPLRRSQLGRYASSWSADGWHRSVLPDDIELGYFNAAPRDQQVEAIRDGERFVLENLHPEHAQLVTRLPGMRPRAFVERAGRPPEELPLRGDTLWFDTDRGICCLTWRGQLSLEARDEPGRVLVAIEEARQRITFQEVVAIADARADSYSGVKTRMGGTNVDHAAARQQAASIDAPDTVMTMIHPDGPTSSASQPSTEPSDPETHDRSVTPPTWPPPSTETPSPRTI